MPESLPERRVFPVGGGNDGLDAVRSVMAAQWLVQARSVWLRLAKAQELHDRHDYGDSHQ